MLVIVTVCVVRTRQECSRASGDASLREEALAVFGDVLKWAANPALLDRPVLAGAADLCPLSVPMILLNLILELQLVIVRYPSVCVPVWLSV